MSDASDNTLTGEDAMAYRFLSKAANAIVSASDLSMQLTTLRDDLAGISQHRDTLEDIRRTQDERIALLESQLERALVSEAEAVRKQGEAMDTVAARQRDIDLLDATVADLTTQRDILAGSLGDAQATIGLQSDVIDRVLGQLNKVRHAMGQGDLDPDPREEIAAAIAPSPSADGTVGSEHYPVSEEEIGDGLDDPNYRRSDPVIDEYQDRFDSMDASDVKHNSGPRPEWDRPQGWDYAKNEPVYKEDKEPVD